MKILELRLLACGPFSDFSLDLSGGDRGLHLIFGPNEAGKSSALRAITYLCFGFPPQLNDDFIHPYSSLRVGARLRNERGEELDFVRRKTTKNSLRDRDDTALVDDDELRRFLADVDLARFKTFFGIDHAMLVKGGKEIVEGNGDTGQILFSAGGANDLKEVLDGLKTEAEQLFMPSARASRKLNQLFSEMTEARRTLRESQLPAREWDEHHQALESATKRKQAAESALHEKTREKSRLERIGKALPLIAELADARQEVATLSGIALLRADFPKRRRATTEELRRAEDERKRASTSAGKLKQQLDELTIPQALLGQRASIEPLAQGLGVFQQAQRDRPGLVAEAQQLDEDAVDILRQLGKDLDLAAAEAMQLPEAKRQRIRNVGEKYATIVQDIGNWTSTLDDLKSPIEENAAEIARLPAVQDVWPLSTALQDTLRLGNVEEDLTAARRDCESSIEQLTISLKKLPLWAGSVEEIETLPVPLADTIDRFDDELANLEKEKKDLDRRLEDCQKEDGELHQKLESLRLEFDLPTEADLHSARQRRQQGWQLVRKALSADEPAPEDVRNFVDAIGDGDGLAGAFEYSIETSDQIADRLRREANRVATKAQLLARKTDCNKRIALVARSQESVAGRREAILADWKRLWQPVCSAPLPPVEMRRWSQQHSELIQKAQALRRHRERVLQLEGRVEDRRGRLIDLLAAIGDAPIPASATLEQLVDIARKVLEDATAIAQRRRDLTGESARLEKQRKRAQDKLAAVQATLLSWQGEWAEAIAELPLDASGGPGEANSALDLLAKLNEQQRRIRGTRKRIAQINSSADQFAMDVRAAAARAAPELRETSIATLAADLGARLSKAIADDEKRALLELQMADEQVNLTAADNMIDKMQSQIATLCLEAKCESAADLPTAEEQSDERRKLEERIQELENRLRDFSAGQTLAVFVADAQSVDADTLQSQIRQLDEQINQFADEKDELGPTIGAEKHALQLMDCSAKAADAAEHVQDMILQIAVESQKYARLQIALVTLRKGIERYREHHQGPIIRRSSELFSRLTLGAFSGLREDYDDDGKPELVAVRAADDRVVRTAEMSDGTADQLFLAVRLAWLCEYLDGHPAIPFIVDDILIRFDDERSAATLQVLAELSAQTQVILFTHHRHVVEIAHRTLDADSLFVHDLPAAAAVQST